MSRDTPAPVPSADTSAAGTAAFSASLIVAALADVPVGGALNRHGPAS